MIVHRYAKTEFSEPEKYCRVRLGASVVGVASVERFEEAPTGHRPDDLLPGAESVVFVALRVLRHLFCWKRTSKKTEIIPEVVRVHEPFGYRDTHFVFKNASYREGGVEFLNQELERIAFRLTLYIEDLGYESMYLPSSEPIVDTFVHRGVRLPFHTPFSHRHAGVLGLGELGLNNLLLTPKYGPGVRLNSVITTEKIEPDPIYEKLCKGE